MFSIIICICVVICVGVTEARDHCTTFTYCDSPSYCCNGRGSSSCCTSVWL